MTTDVYGFLAAIVVALLHCAYKAVQAIRARKHILFILALLAFVGVIWFALSQSLSELSQSVQDNSLFRKPGLYFAMGLYALFFLTARFSAHCPNCGHLLETDRGAVVRWPELLRTGRASCPKCGVGAEVLETFGRGPSEAVGAVTGAVRDARESQVTKWLDAIFQGNEERRNAFRWWCIERFADSKETLSADQLASGMERSPIERYIGGKISAIELEREMKTALEKFALQHPLWVSNSDGTHLSGF